MTSSGSCMHTEQLYISEAVDSGPPEAALVVSITREIFSPAFESISQLP